MNKQYSHSISILLFTFCLLPSLASANSVSLAINGVTSAAFTLGQSWNLSVTSDIPNAIVTLCAIDNHGSQGCTPNDGSTNSSGAWSLGGGFAASTVGSWQEWVQVATTNGVVTSNSVSFTVNSTPGATTGSAQNTSSICQTGIPSDPNPAGNFTYNSGQLCTSFSGCHNLSTIMTPTLDTANTVAAALGATVSANNNILGADNTYNTVPVYTLTFPNGYTVDAGYVAYLYDSGFTSQDAQFQQVLQGACGSTATSGTGGSSGTGTTGGTTQNTTQPVKVSNATDAQNVTINNIYASTQQIAQQALMLYDKIASLSSNSNTLTPPSQSTSLPNRDAIISLLTGVSSSTPANTSIAFPVSVGVTATTLNVRSAPNTSASLAGSQTLHVGDYFIATSEVVGESVSGNDLWWVSSKGNYVWSGGTTVVGNNNG